MKLAGGILFVAALFLPSYVKWEPCEENTFTVFVNGENVGTVSEVERAEELLPIIIEKINTSALLGNNTLTFEWSEDVKSKISFNDWNIFCKYHKDYFVKLGYKFCTHEYSKSWRERSGKIGYATIYWC